MRGRDVIAHGLKNITRIGDVRSYLARPFLNRWAGRGSFTGDLPSKLMMKSQSTSGRFGNVAQQEIADPICPL